MGGGTQRVPDQKMLRLLDRVIVTMMVAILLVLTLPVMQAAHPPKSAQAIPQQMQPVLPTHPVSHDRVTFS